jgi:hypothetical protein
MPDMSGYRQSHRLFIQSFGRCRPSDSTTIFEAGVFSYLPLSSGRTTGKEFFHASDKLLDVVTVRLLSANSFTLSSTLSHLTIAETLCLGLLKSR